MYEILFIVFVGLFVYAVKDLWIANFKISYYETKLKNRDVDISHIENISLIEIINLN